MISATYVSGSQFTVDGDHTLLFETGLALKAVQGEDGTLAAWVTTATYDVGTSKTTVTVTPASLTNNLVNVLVSYVAPSNLPNTVAQLVGGITPLVNLPPMGLVAPLHGTAIFGPTAVPVFAALGLYVINVSGTAYFMYQGQVIRAFTPAHARTVIYSAGSSTQVAEIGFFSSPLPPNGAGQTLTKLVATGTVDSLTSATTALKGNTAAFTTEIAAGTHLWVGIRTAMAGNQPYLYNVGQDYGMGIILSKSSADALDSATTTWAASAIAAGTGGKCPLLFGTLY